MKKWLPWIIVAVMACWVGGTLQSPKDATFAYTDFGRLPIVDNGRVQPLESEARNSLLQMRGKQTLNLEPWKEWYQSPKIIPANEWIATVMMNSSKADEWPMFRIDHPDLIAQLKLPQKDIENHQDGKHYSWNQIEPNISVMDRESKRIGERERKKMTEPSQRTPYESAVMTLHGHLIQYMRLKNSIQPQDADNWPAELAEFETLITPGVAALRAEEAKQDHDDALLKRFERFAGRFEAMVEFQTPYLVPPLIAGRSHEEWLRVGDSLVDEIRGQALPPAVHQLAEIAGAFKAGNVADFNSKLAAYRASLLPALAPEMKKVAYEGFFDHMEPFYSAMVIYVLAFILACSFWFNLSDPLRRSAVYLIVLAFVIHTSGLIFRMWLEGRPPVTNLYIRRPSSSAGEP